MVTGSKTEPSLELLLRLSVNMLQADPIAAKKRFRLTLEERQDRTMSEKQLSSRIRYRAKKYGWLTVHFTQARVGGTTEDGGTWATPVGGDSKGWPDLVLVKAGHRLAFRELKKELGKLTPEQFDWLDLLDSCGYDAAVWRPSDLRSGVIDAFFRG